MIEENIKESNVDYSPISKLLFTLEKTGKNYDFDKIKKAYEYAAYLHEGQKRASGEDYIVHPIAVAEIVATLELDTDSICAALLHDTVEDCADKVDTQKIRRDFGEETLNLVDGLTKLVQIPFEDKEEQHMENLRKMFLAMSKDIRVIFIKLCDRLHNMRTLDAKPEEKQRITALETMHVYAPLAHRLGMQRIKQELENLALSYLDPIGYNEVKSDIEQRYGQNQNFIENTRRSIDEKMSELGFKYSLEGRVKTVYSIYRKMFQRGKSFEEIYDFYALRIIVDSELECYTALGVIHDMFKSVPGRFKDYISTPKPNMYQSLHTTVIGRDGIPFEVQIRTWEMHRIAEYGIAAHWKYKSGAESKEEVDRKLQWVSRLIDAEEGTVDPEEFEEALKIDIFHDETFVFTPKGDVITLPYGATVIDFAYAIHSEVGNRMTGAKINGMIVPIDSVPQNGEIVSIITSNSSKGPSRDWLSIVKTSEARTKIRQWFKHERYDENVELGRNEIERELRKYNRNFTDEQRKEILTNISNRIGMHDIESLYATIGYGGLPMAKIQAKLRHEFDRVVKEPEPEKISLENIKTAEVKPHKRSVGGVILDGVDGLAVKFSKCCNPLPGDDICGFITRGFGVSIHKCDCPNVILNRDKPDQEGRWLTAEWDTDSGRKGVFEAQLQVYAKNSLSLLAEITTALADMRVSLLSISTKPLDETEILVLLKVGARDKNHLSAIENRLRQIKHINSVNRGLGK